MEVEDRFGVSIPDEDASRVATVGEMHEYLVKRLRVEGAWHASDVWDALVVVVSRVLRVPESAVGPSSRFVADLGIN